MGQVRAGVSVHRVVKLYANGSLLQNKPFLAGRTVQELRDEFDRLRDELATNGEVYHASQLAERRRASLLDRNVFAQREESEREGGADEA